MEGPRARALCESKRLLPGVYCQNTNSPGTEYPTAHTGRHAVQSWAASRNDRIGIRRPQ